MIDPGALVEVAEREAHAAADNIERGCWCKKSIGYVCPAHESRETAHAAIARLARIARLAGRVEQAEIDFMHAAVSSTARTALDAIGGERDRLRAELAALEEKDNHDMF